MEYVEEVFGRKCADTLCAGSILKKSSQKGFLKALGSGFNPPFKSTKRLLVIYYCKKCRKSYFLDENGQVGIPNT